MNEQRMLEQLPHRFGLSKNLDNVSVELNSLQFSHLSLRELAKGLDDHGDRCLAAHLACLIAGISRNPGDLMDINEAERSAYRELVEILELSSDELNEIEWSVRQELSRGHSLFRLIGDVLFGAGCWPDSSLMSNDLHEF